VEPIIIFQVDQLSTLDPLHTQSTTVLMVSDGWFTALPEYFQVLERTIFVEIPFCIFVQDTVVWTGLAVTVHTNVMELP
jgi:hypothetical protein